jgi:hypothetical protein
MSSIEEAERPSGRSLRMGGAGCPLGSAGHRLICFGRSCETSNCRLVCRP